MLIFSFCVGFPHTLSESAIFLYLFVYESQVFVTWPLLGRERTLGMRPWECNEILGMSVVLRPFSRRVLSVGEYFDLFSQCD